MKKVAGGIHARDAWSVYLYDYDRGMRIQLDLSREVVSFSWEVSGETTDLYNITAAR